MRDSTVITEPKKVVVEEERPRAVEQIQQKVIVEERRPRRMVMESTFLNLGLLILRLAVGGLMLFHGIAKINSGVEMLKPALVAKGIPDFFVYGIYIAEVLAPVMIILGIRTRLAALTI